MIPFIMMGLAIVIFVAGTPKYTKPKPQGSAVGSAVAVCWEALWTNRKAVVTSKQVLDKASVENGGTFSQNKVESVKLVTRLLPFLGVLVAFWGIYGQMSTAFQNQGCQMELSAGPVKVPVSALSLFDTIAILMLVPVFDGYLYPWLKKRGHRVSMLDKVSWGFVFAMLAMVCAGLIEMYRLKEKRDAGGYFDTSARDNISPCQNIDDYNPKEYQKWDAGKGDVEEPANCHQINGCDLHYADGKYSFLNLTCIECDDIPQMSKLSVFWQVPQFCLIGASEVLAAITSLEFFYSQAPTSMRSVSQALNLFTYALGSWLTIPLIILVNSGLFGEDWVPENLDEGHLSYYFFLLAGLMVANQVSD
jgi:dipeptide/tripeptide permease